jgi:toxin-antitoxin system PIN domain toxin
LISLLDVNVLLSLAWSNHPHHHLAHGWFAREATLGWATCLLTQIGFLRLSLNPKIVGVALDCQAVMALLAGLTAHPNHRFVDLAPTITAAPFDELVPAIAGHQQITDAALMHLARFHGMKLVTLDQAASALCPWSGNLEVIVP